MEENSITFEEALNELENIVRNIENDSVCLEDSLNMFNRGIALVQICNQKLDSAKHKIEIVKNDYYEKNDIKSNDIMESWNEF